MNSLQFGLWLEQDEAARPAVFCDLDETLVHRFEIGWLKDSPQNKEFAKLVVPGKKPYPDVKKIHADDKDFYIFPRPGATSFIKSINEFASFYLLSHASAEYIDNVVNALGWKSFVEACYSTGDTKPGELAKKYKLESKKWLLVDNLDIHSIEITNKLRILGLGTDAKDPKDVAREVMKQADQHFIDVSDWVPTVHEYDDYELWKILPKIKEMLGLDWSKGDPYF